MLKIILDKSYRRSNGEGGLKKNEDQSIFVGFMYRVYGPPAELTQFEALQLAKSTPVKSIKDDQSHLWFTSDPVGPTGSLKIASTGNIYADTTNIDMYNSLIKHHGEVGRLMVTELIKKEFWNGLVNPEPAAEATEASLEIPE